MKLKRMFLTAVAATFLTCAAYASYCGALILNGNFHTVEAGRLYRSAQLSKAEFAREIGLHHIRTVLNLRGPNDRESWYRDELAAASENGAGHYDVVMSAREVVSPDKVAKILAILRDAPKPILVHCKSGADRTGFVSALYRFAIQGKTAAEAEQELTVWYGHFPYLTSKTGAMDESVHAYFLRHPHAVTSE